MPPKKTTTKTIEPVAPVIVDGAKFSHIVCGSDDLELKLMINCNCRCDILLDHIQQETQRLLVQLSANLASSDTVSFQRTEEPQLSPEDTEKQAAFARIKEKLSNKVDLIDESGNCCNCNQHSATVSTEILKPGGKYFLAAYDDIEKTFKKLQ